MKAQALSWLRLRQPALLNYGMAVLAVVVALLITRFLQATFGYEPLVVPFLWAILLGAWFGGTGPGVLAMLLSLFAFRYCTSGLVYPLGMPKELPRLLSITVTALLILLLNAAQRRTNASLKRARNVLDETLLELKRTNASLEAENAVRQRAEEALKKAEYNLRFILDATPAMIHTARPDGYLDYYNQRWLSYVGRSLEELLGWGWMTVIHPEDVDGEVKKWRACIASGEPFECEVRMRRADGQYRWVLHRKVAVRDEQGNIIKWCGSSLDLEDRRRAEQLLRDSREQLRALSARLESLREEERIRIAREIHDDLGAKLTALKMDLQWLERKFGELDGTVNNALLERAVTATELTNEVILAVQRLARELRPVVLDKLGLAAAMQFAVREFCERTGIACTVQVPPEELNPSTAVSTALYRILQECLTNVVRHSRATRVEVLLTSDGDRVFLRVRDNGRGIDPAALGDMESLGLLGMRERVLQLDGEISIERGREGGTVVAVEFPLQAREKELHHVAHADR